MALEAGQSAECLVALGTQQLLTNLVRGQVESVILLHVVRGPALLASKPPVLVMGLEVPPIARQTVTDQVTSSTLKPPSCVGLLESLVIFWSPDPPPQLIIVI